MKVNQPNIHFISDIKARVFFCVQLCISSPRPTALELASSVQYSARAGGAAWLSAVGHQPIASMSKPVLPYSQTGPAAHTSLKAELAEGAAQSFKFEADYDGCLLTGESRCPDSQILNRQDTRL